MNAEPLKPASMLAPQPHPAPDVTRAARLILADEHERVGRLEHAEFLRGEEVLPSDGQDVTAIRAMAAFAALHPVPLRPAAGAASPLVGDFRCHHCKHVVHDVFAAPQRCPTCRGRDFSAVAPVSYLGYV
ncbi:hypothetical protein [Sphingomonas sp. 3-13AW]|uniref:hypothetical protein n=1 Tax=Sphingomonas sp. 3-13AW TaxID=3050450 RepID=UPI003BB6156F